METRFVGWGAAITDLDNDGLPDLFFTSGMVYPEAEGKLPDAPWRTPRVVFRNLGGARFEELQDERGPGRARSALQPRRRFWRFRQRWRRRYPHRQPERTASLLRNDLSGEAHWLKVLLVGTVSNRSAIGAQVVATYGDRRQAQAVLGQSSYLSASDRRLYFGLGEAAKADLEIRRPNGGTETIRDVAADRLVTIREGSGIVRADRFGKSDVARTLVSAASALLPTLLGAQRRRFPVLQKSRHECRD
ncbi:MAG TPA: ASPIC/UnbV domain-containing protein [Bryobacteraceae bacterium]|nr:ASPIC/UnbV domain-containing protein [Bryobacteraceae bacterium]